jgi:hypothetical protein
VLSKALKPEPAAGDDFALQTKAAAPVAATGSAPSDAASGSTGELVAQASAPRTYEGRLHGGTVTATPMGPPGSNGQTLYEVTLRTGGHTIKVEAYLTGQFGPDQLRPDSPIKRQLDAELAEARRSEASAPASPSSPPSSPSAPRTYEARLYGGTVRAVPWGQPADKGQTRYQVTVETGDGRRAQIDVLLTGQFGPEQLQAGSPTKRQLDQALAAQQAERRAQAGYSTFEAGLFGGNVTAVPSERDARGNSTWDITWSGREGTFSTEARLAGQFGAAQLVDGSYAKNQLGAQILAARARQIPSSVSEASFRNVGMDAASAPIAAELYRSMRDQGHGIEQSWNRTWQSYLGGYASGGPDAGRRSLSTTVVNPPASSQRQPTGSNADYAQRSLDTLGREEVPVNIASSDYNPAVPGPDSWRRFNPLPGLLGTDGMNGSNAHLARPLSILNQINRNLPEDQRLGMDENGNVDLPNNRTGGQVLATMFYAQDGLYGSQRNAYGDFDIDALARQEGLSPAFVAGFKDTRRQILRGEAAAAIQTIIAGLAATAPRVGTSARPTDSNSQYGARTEATPNAPPIPIVRNVTPGTAGTGQTPGNARLNPGTATPQQPQLPSRTGVSPGTTTIDVQATTVPNTPTIGSPAPTGQQRLPGAPPPSIPDVRNTTPVVREAVPVLQFPSGTNATPGVPAGGNRPALPAAGLPGTLATTPNQAPIVPAPGLPGSGNAGGGLNPPALSTPTLATPPIVTPTLVTPLPTAPVNLQTGNLQTGSLQTGSQTGSQTGNLDSAPQAGTGTAVRDREPTLQVETPATPGTLAGADAPSTPTAGGPKPGQTSGQQPAQPGADPAPGRTESAPTIPQRPQAVSEGAGTSGLGTEGAAAGAGGNYAPEPDEDATLSTDAGDSSAIVPSTQTGRPETGPRTQVEAVETGIPAIDPEDIKVGRTRAVPATPNPATPERMAEAIRAANPDAEVRMVHNGTIAEMTFTSGTGDKAETRTALVGNYQDIRDYNPELARAVTEYLPRQSLLYDGRSPESVDQVFEGTDISVVIADPRGRPIGMANLTYQTAVYADGETGPVLYLAQVAGENGGGRQATALLHRIAEAERVTMTASAFPGNVWNPPSERFPQGRSGLYGPNAAPGNPEPDAMIAWQASDTNPLDASGKPNPPRISLNPDRFGPDQPFTTNPDGTSIFAPMHPFPVEPFATNLGTSYGEPLTQAYENGMYSVRLGDDPRPVASAGRPLSIGQFEQAGSRPRQALEARAQETGIATGDPAQAFVAEQDPTIDPGTSLRNADRVKYAWLYGAEDPDNLSVDDIPSFVYLDDRLGDQNLRHPKDPTQPDRPGNPNRPSSVFGQPYPETNPADEAAPQSNDNNPDHSSSTILPQIDPGTPVITSADDLTPRTPFNIDELVPPITGNPIAPRQTSFDPGNTNLPRINGAQDLTSRFPTDLNRVSLYAPFTQDNDLAADTATAFPPFDTPVSGVPTINSAADLEPGVPYNLDELVPPEILASGTLNDMPADLQAEAALLSAEQGIPFVQRLADGKHRLVEHVNNTWQPVQDFRNDVLSTAQQGVNEAWDTIPAPMRNAIRTTGTVLGVVADPVGAAFGAGVNKFNEYLETPQGQALTAPLRGAADRAGEAWEELGEHPQGRHIVNAWNNSLGHPRVPELMGNFAQGSGQAVQAIANGGLGLLAAGLVTGETEFGTFTTGSPKDLPPELAQIYRQVAIVPRGVELHYGTVPIPGTPNGRVTVWTAGTAGMALRPGLPGEVGTAQPTVASTWNPANGKPEFMGWVNFVAGGPTQWGGVAVNLTDNIGIQRSAFAQLGSGVVQTPVIRGSTEPGPYRFDQTRTAPVFEPTTVTSLAATRFGVTDEIRFIVPLGEGRDLPINILSTRMRAPIRPTAVGTIINQNPATGNFGLRPQGNIDFNAKPNPAGLTVYGTQGGYNPNADDWGQIRQILRIDETATPQALPGSPEVAPEMKKPAIME